MTTRILVVDDEANLRRMLEAVLAEEAFIVRTAADADAAATIVHEFEPEVALVDLVLGDGANGIDLLERLRDARPETVVIMMSGKATLADAVRATKLGAFQFLEKPLSPVHVTTTARAAADLARARAENRWLRARLEAEHPIVGTSAALDAVRKLIAQVAPTPSRVLITGESGTGKELVARAIHAQSPRAARPFVAINCAAVPRELIESELFGHEKGAFTGATERRDGRFALAHHGTLLLDEVGELEPQAQAKLLRVLETGTIERVGGSATQQVDVRVLAATNKHPEEEVRAGRFRQDLFFRLNVFPIHVPALRERLDDLPPLIEFLAIRAAERCNRLPRPFGPDALAALRRHRWPGNVRELANLVERLTIMGQGEVTVEELAMGLGARRPALGHIAPAERRPPGAESLADALARHETQLIQEALAHTGSIAEAARAMKTDRANLYRRMKRLGLSPSDTPVSE